VVEGIGKEKLSAVAARMNDGGGRRKEENYVEWENERE
jgi:hypothetical protein